VERIREVRHQVEKATKSEKQESVHTSGLLVLFSSWIGVQNPEEFAVRKIGCGLKRFLMALVYWANAPGSRSGATVVALTFFTVVLHLSRVILGPNGQFRRSGCGEPAARVSPRPGLLKTFSIIFSPAPSSSFRFSSLFNFHPQPSPWPPFCGPVIHTGTSTKTSCGSLRKNLFRSGSSRFGLLIRSGFLFVLPTLPLDSLYWNIWLDYWIKRFTGRSFKISDSRQTGLYPLKNCRRTQQEMFF